MTINWGDLFTKLELLLPIIGSITGNPEVATLVDKLVHMAEGEIERRMAENPNATRAEILADAARTYAEAKAENEKLKQLGHE